MLVSVSVGKAEQASATRVRPFNGSLAAGQTIHVENISGDIVASPGRQFSAVVTLTVSAATQAKADEILKKTRDRAATTTTTAGTSRPCGPDAVRAAAATATAIPCDQCRIVARYEIVMPPGVTAELQTVNGDVRVRDLDGELNVSTVNGSIEVRGARQSVSAQTVNGKVDAIAQALPADAEVSHPVGQRRRRADAARGRAVRLRGLDDERPDRLDVPAAAARRGDRAVGRDRAPARRRKTPKPDKGASPDRTWSRTRTARPTSWTSRSSTKSSRTPCGRSRSRSRRARRGCPRSTRSRRRLRQIRVPNPHREYTGSIGKGGASIHMQTLNGTVLLLAAGTKERDAKPLVSERSTFVVTVPKRAGPRRRRSSRPRLPRRRRRPRPRGGAVPPAPPPPRALPCRRRPCPTSTATSSAATSPATSSRRRAASSYRIGNVAGAPAS